MINCAQLLLLIFLLFVTMVYSLVQLRFPRVGLLFWKERKAISFRHSTSSNDEMKRCTNWENQWKCLEEMRKNHPAAVDTMGAEALSSNSNCLGRDDEREFRFRTLIATMLSPQTRDENTAAAFRNIIKLIEPSPFLPSTLEHLDLQAIETAIQPVSFAKTKATNLLKAAQRCSSEYSNDIPAKIEDLLSFAGVGPKIAYLTFSIAWGKTEGICVDTHVHRIANRLGWVDTWEKKSNGAEYTRKQLELLLPKEKWYAVNSLLVGFGQTICSAQQPKCNQCSLRSSCLFYRRQQANSK